jgi:hypothetical protein
MTRSTTRHGLDARECEALARVLDWLAHEMAEAEQGPWARRINAAASWPGRAATVLHAEAARLRALDEQQEGAPCG